MATVDFLDRYFEPVAAALTTQAAQAIVELQPDAASIARVEELGRKADEGTLTDSEREEYRQYVDAGDLIALLKAQARRTLAEKRT